MIIAELTSTVWNLYTLIVLYAVNVVLSKEMSNYYLRHNGSEGAEMEGELGR